MLTMLAVILVLLVASISFAVPPRFEQNFPRSRDTEPQGIVAPAQLELAILDEINLARANPRQYAAFLHELKPLFEGNLMKRLGRADFVTNEGVAAADEAISFLMKTKPLEPMAWTEGLRRAAADHAWDMVSRGVSGHTGSDGSTPTDRVARSGEWEFGVGGTIIYSVTTAREIVVGMIIDDGVATRGHRRNVFSPTFKVAAVAIAQNARGERNGTVVFAGSYREKKRNEATTPISKPARKPLKKKP